MRFINVDLPEPFWPIKAIFFLFFKFIEVFSKINFSPSSELYTNLLIFNVILL